MDEAELERQIQQGAAAYNPLLLAMYDTWVYGVAVRVMRCPPSEFFTFYELNVTEQHLDIGVGSGSLLRHCLRQQLLERVTLMDLNPHCLQAAERRCGPCRCRRCRRMCLNPFPWAAGNFCRWG